MSFEELFCSLSNTLLYINKEMQYVCKRDNPHQKVQRMWMEAATCIDGCMALNNKKTSYRLSCIVSCNEKTDMLSALNNARSSMI